MKELTDQKSRDMARRMRDGHWSLLERLNRHGTLYVCPWDKYGRHKKPEPDLEVLSPLSQDIFSWFKVHSDWIDILEWDEQRCAYPFAITDAGREALDNRTLYDMEPVEGGLVEPGWTAIPTSKET